MREIGDTKQWDKATLSNIEDGSVDRTKNRCKARDRYYSLKEPDIEYRMRRWHRKVAGCNVWEVW